MVKRGRELTGKKLQRHAAKKEKRGAKRKAEMAALSAWLKPGMTLSQTRSAKIAAEACPAQPAATVVVSQ